jgi:V/A-type H+-transporting ATPase subunit I
MAIAQMRKVTAIVDLELLDEAITLLQKSGVLAIAGSQDQLPYLEVNADDADLHKVETNLAKARYIRDALAAHHKSEAPLSMLVSEKFHLDEGAYQDIVFDGDWEALYLRCEDIAADISELRTEHLEIASRLDSLMPWKECPVPFDQWQGTAHTGFFAGIATHDVLSAVNVALDDSQELSVDIEKFAPSAKKGAAEHAFIARMHANDEGTVRTLLVDSGAREVRFDKDHGRTAADEIGTLHDRRDSHDNRLQSYQDELRELAGKHFSRTMVLIQALGSAHDRVTIRSQFACTEKVFLINGWICADQEVALIRAFEPYTDQIDLAFSDPSVNDDPPIELVNPKWLQPFELLTNLYGRPKYGRIDPTPFIAPFFVFFVAVCVGDVGYGLMMAAAFAVIMTRLDVAPNVVKFSKLMIWGGLAAVPMGVLLGGYFSLPFETIPPFLQNLRAIDPLEEIVTFLIIAMAIGAVHLAVGILISTYEYVRNGQWQVALGTKVSIFVFVGSIAAFILTGANHLWVLFGGIAVTTLMQGYGLLHKVSPEQRTPKKIIVSVFAGLYEVYGMTSLLNEALSYTRLAALGLASALVGMVFNIMAGLVMEPVQSLFAAGGTSIITGVLVMLAVALIFIIGHSFNVLINLIGAFVHPMRLQFVEFFGTFYDAGGASFEPFAFRKDNLVFEDKE